MCESGYPVISVCTPANPSHPCIKTKPLLLSALVNITDGVQKHFTSEPLNSVQLNSKEKKHTIMNRNYYKKLTALSTICVELVEIFKLTLCKQIKRKIIIQIGAVLF